MKRYIKSDSGFGKDFNVFMLMDYRADTGPDTMGMEGDSFDCLGKFFAKDLQSAKNELRTILSAHPELKEVCPGLYVDNYNEYFDSDTREEQDEYGNPYDVDNNVFADLETLIDKCFDWDYINSYAKGLEEDNELPFSADDSETLKSTDENFCVFVISNTVEEFEFDPDYENIIKDISWDYDYDSEVFSVVIKLYEGSDITLAFGSSELRACNNYIQGTKLVRDRIIKAIQEI